MLRVPIRVSRAEGAGRLRRAVECQFLANLLQVLVLLEALFEVLFGKATVSH